MSVKSDLKKLGLKESDFSKHQTDLYVRKKPEVENYLETYEFKGNVKEFVDDIDGEIWYDFPFAAD